MNDGLISPHWYRVSSLKPRLHAHIEIHRHDYRGLIWYMLEDSTTGRNHRFNPAAYQFIGLLDGKRSVQQIFDQLSEQLEDYAPGQEDIIQLLGQLHSADLIISDSLINSEELFDRQASHKQTKIKQRIMNPVALKVPLWDPDDFLTNNFNKVKWIFSFHIAFVWLMVVGYGIVQVTQNWNLVSQHFIINALAPYNLLLMFLLYPPIKFLHELGHAFSAKLEGGEVHEMGVNFLLFMPIPYVNVSTAAHFRSKYKRMLVSAAGILVESFLASLGLLLFLAAEPGLVQNIGFNIFIIGGVSSLFFNGNPLLKYDGYYILADALDIPNLYQRAAHYWAYLFQRYLFGLDQTRSPASAPGETFWFITYSLGSLAYRLGVLWFIFVLVTDKFFLLGVILTGWLLTLQVLAPLAKALAFLVNSPSLRQKRARAVVTSVGIIGVLVALLGFMPVPSFTHSQGIVWQPDEALLKVEHDGFIRLLPASRAAQVESGASVVRLDDPFLIAQLKMAEARSQELNNRYRAKRVSNSFEAGIIREELRVAQSELDHLVEEKQRMTVTAFKSGRLEIPQINDLPGSFVRKGELLGYILDRDPDIIRMAVSQDHIGQLRQHIKDIRVRFVSHIEREYPATIVRQAPEATNELPDAALSTEGGGPFIVMPDSESALITRQKVFIVDLQFDPGDEDIRIGTRAHVRIDHGGEPLAAQLMRRVRQVFLRQINV